MVPAGEWYRWGPYVSERLFGAEPVTPYPKDGINGDVVDGAMIAPVGA